MLAPAFESVLDVVEPAHAAMLRAARDLWTRTGVPLIQDGALWTGGAPDAVQARLEACGFVAERRGDGVFTPEDWRLDPVDALTRLTAGATRIDADGGAVADGVRLAGGRLLAADLVVLATGAAGDRSDVTPVRGQLLELEGPAPPFTIRAEGVYVTPRSGGALVGASMEPGRTDLTPDDAVTERLFAAAKMAWPPLATARLTGVRVGIRGATPDGLPLAGPVAPGLSVALAPRRNGWLLAPLVAQIVAAYADGDDPGPYAAALDPLRFAPTA